MWLQFFLGPINIVQSAVSTHGDPNKAPTEAWIIAVAATSFVTVALSLLLHWGTPPGSKHLALHDTMLTNKALPPPAFPVPSLPKPSGPFKVSMVPSNTHTHTHPTKCIPHLMLRFKNPFVS